jgi:glycosyltransferase involved in cell wall biosynthesis
MKLILDARMIRMSGIGRYIQSLIPMLLEIKGLELTLLGRKEELADYNLPIIEMRSGIYSPLEQIEFLKVIPPTDIFWSPHYNIPILPIRVKKRLVTIHDVFPITPLSSLDFLKKTYARFLISQAIRRSDIVFTISRFSREELQNYFRLKKKHLDKIRVIYHSLDEQFAVPLSSKKAEKALSNRGINSNFILYVGNVKPHKNLEGLLKAFAIVQKKFPELKLVIVGQKERFITGLEGLPGLLEKFSLKEKVHFTGIIQDAELLALYQKAELLILPSFYEGFGWPPLEAMACSCAVILSDIPPLREIYEDAAYYVDPYSVYSISEGITKLLCDPGLKNTLIKKGLEKSKEFHSEKFKAAYRKALEEIKGALETF